MLPSTLDRIAVAWNVVSGVPHGWVPGKITVASSAASAIAPPGWVGTIRLGAGSVAAGALITAPDEPQAALVRDTLGTAQPEQATDRPAWGSLWPSDPGCILGPAELAYLDAPDFAPRVGEPVEAVALADVEDAIAALERDAGPDDANEVGITDATSPLFVIWRAATIAGVCAYRPWVGRLAHMMVLTHPDHRGQGLAKRAATEASRHALDAGLIPQWRARAPASQAVARSVGYTTVGAQLSLRLRLR
ncbi:MAG TPA: GNAT family N-acetyltransferase [Micromonosporaceae bacterium]|jgi:GNAT superfamily N-acetyltransferase